MTSDQARRVAHTLTLRILRGTIQPGEELPSVRSLSASEGVNPATVHRALAHLASAGLVQTRARSGTVALDPDRHGDLALLPLWLEALADRPAEAGARLASFLELRRMVAIALLARHRDRILASAPEILAEPAPSSDDAAGRAEADLVRVRRLVDATGNHAARAVFQTVERLLIATPGLVEAMYPPGTDPGQAALVAWLLDPSAERLAAVDAALAVVDASTVRRFVGAA